MGDLGSLALGGLLAGFAICTRTEMAFPFIVAVQFVEVVSVILQVASFQPVSYTHLAKGEIRELCGIAKPRFGVLTDISESHIGVLGSIEKIACAKAEILESLPDDGMAFLCWDSEFVRKMSCLARCRVVSYGLCDDADCRAFDIRKADESAYQFKVGYLGKVEEFILHMPGLHQIQNSLAAIAIGYELGLSTEDIRLGLCNVNLSPMRQEVVHTEKVTIVNDCLLYTSVLYTEGDEEPAEGMVRVPSIVGLGMTQARAKLKDSGLSLSAEGNGFCVTQEPQAGKIVPVGTTVKAVFRMDVGQ